MKHLRLRATHVKPAPTSHAAQQARRGRAGIAIGTSVTAAAVVLGALTVASPAALAAKGGGGKPARTSSTATATPVATTTTAAPAPTSATPTATASPTPTATPTATAAPAPVQSTTEPAPTATASSPSATTSTVTAAGYTYVTPESGYREKLVMPEGATVSIASDVTWWSAAQVADLLRANAYQLSLLGPTLRVRVQTTYASQATVTASTTNGVYSKVSAVVWLNAKSGTYFSTYPADVVAHEYGHAWTYYYYYLVHQGSWAKYLAARGLSNDTRVGSSYSWGANELIADDYRLLLGSSAAACKPYIQSQLADPRTVTGLRDFLLAGWTAR